MGLGHSTLGQRNGDTAWQSPRLHDGGLHLVVERLVAPHLDLQVIQEVPVAGDLEPRAGADPDEGGPTAILERDDDVAVDIEHEVAEWDVVRPEVATDRQVAVERRL